MSPDLGIHRRWSNAGSLNRITLQRLHHRPQIHMHKVSYTNQYRSYVTFQRPERHYRNSRLQTHPNHSSKAIISNLIPRLHPLIAMCFLGFLACGDQRLQYQ